MFGEGIITMYEPAPYTPPVMTRKEKWQLAGKVVITIVGIAALFVLGVLWLALLPLRVAIWKEKGVKPITAGETVALGAIGGFLFNLWRQEHPDEKAYRRGVELGFTDAAREAGRRAGKQAAKDRADFGEVPY